MATGSQDGTVILWDAASLVRKGQPLKHDGRINRLKFSPDGKYLGTAGADRISEGGEEAPVEYAARLWEVASGICKRILRGHAGQVTDLSFSSNGRIATCATDGVIRVWEVASEKPARVIATEASLEEKETHASAITFRDDGLVAVGRSAHEWMEIWNLDEARQVMIMKGHKRGISAVAYRGGQRPMLATASLDGTVRCYYLKPDDLIRWAKQLRPRPENSAANERSPN